MAARSGPLCEEAACMSSIRRSEQGGHGGPLQVSALQTGNTASEGTFDARRGEVHDILSLMFGVNSLLARKRKTRRALTHGISSL